MELLQKAYDQEVYLAFLYERFDFSKDLLPIDIENNDVKSFQELGTVTTQDDKALPVFEIHNTGD